MHAYFLTKTVYPNTSHKVFSRYSLFFALMAWGLVASQSLLANTKVVSGNPLFDGWYADPEVAIIDGEIWIFPTYSDDFEKQLHFDAFSSPDLVHWTKHAKILDDSGVSWLQQALWAPCVVKKEDRYFLFFGANDLQSPESRWWNPAVHSLDDVGGIGVAVATQPEGPYSDLLGHPLIGKVYNGAQPIDQFVFQDKDGQWYIIYGGWGHCNLAKLSDDFSSITPFESGESYLEITPEGYVEGPVMFIRKGIYYFMWSEGNWGDDSYQVAYATGPTVKGPFVKKGVVMQSYSAIATGAGHHSVLNLPETDEWYAIYHRRPIPNLDRDHRVVCIDKMLFDEDGNIMKIELTRDGVEAISLD